MLPKNMVFLCKLGPYGLLNAAIQLPAAHSLAKAVVRTTSVLYCTNELYVPKRHMGAGVSADNNYMQKLAF